MEAQQIAISDDQLQEMVVDSVQNVFMTMLSTEIAFKEVLKQEGETRQPLPKPIESSKELYAGSVGFAGTANGVMFLYLEDSTALKLAGTMLGMSEEEVTGEGPETVNDVLGELANMTVGSFKNKLCDMGYNCRLTIPSILKGQNFAVQNTHPNDKSVIRRLFKFEVQGAPFVADVLIKQGE